MQSSTTRTPASRKSRQRQRRWAPRVRTGCVTCKIRRIKCDETKPSCQKCRSTGRTCDGYEQTWIVHEERFSSTLPQMPSAWDFLSEDTGERESFGFFCSVTTSTLAGLFDFGFWSRRLLQISHHYPALWHCMTALASIHREYVTESTPPSRPRIWENRNIGFALKQSNRAIQSLMQLLSEQCLTALDRMVVLTTNILFTCMCSLQGRQWQAFMHINNGLKLFHQWELGSKLISQPEDRIGADMLLLVFTRLDSQVRPYLLWQTPPLNWADSQITLSSTKAPFTTLLQAYVSLEVLFNGVMRFLLCPDTWSLSRQSVVSAEKLTYLHRLHEWDAKLANLLKDLLESDHGKAIDLLTIRRKFTGLLLATNLTQCELAHDAFLSDYVAIIEAVSRVLGDLKSLVLGRDQSAERPTHANFGLETGIVEPLFWIGVRCREPKIRHQALRLLQRYPRREGICEGMLAAKIVAKVIEIEETGCSQVAKKMCSTSPCTSGPWICEAHRVNTCDVILATERQVRVVIRTVEDWALSRPGTEFVTSWW